MVMRDKAEWQQMVRDNVDKHGWFGTSVFDPDGKNPSFSYSVGFTKTLTAPDFIIFGLSRELMHSMLWSLFDQKASTWILQANEMAKPEWFEPAMMQALNSAVSCVFMGGCFWYYGIKLLEPSAQRS